MLKLNNTTNQHANHAATTVSQQSIAITGHFVRHIEHIRNWSVLCGRKYVSLPLGYENEPARTQVHVLETAAQKTASA